MWQKAGFYQHFMRLVPQLHGGQTKANSKQHRTVDCFVVMEEEKHHLRWMWCYKRIGSQSTLYGANKQHQIVSCLHEKPPNFIKHPRGSLRTSSAHITIINSSIALSPGNISLKFLFSSWKFSFQPIFLNWYTKYII